MICHQGASASLEGPSFVHPNRQPHLYWQFSWRLAKEVKKQALANKLPCSASHDRRASLFAIAVALCKCSGEGLPDQFVA